MDKQRFYIHTEGLDEAAYKKAIKSAYELADNDTSIKRIILLLYAKNQVILLEKIFSSQIIRKLLTDTGYTFPDTKVCLKIETIKTYEDAFSTSADIVITFGINAENIFRLDDFYCTKVIIAIPWLVQGLEKWIKTWEPIELNGEQNAIMPYPLPSLIVQQAFQTLTSLINMSTGISHSSDKEMAKTFVLALHGNEQSLDANAVFAYLVKELNWDTDTANKIEKLIETLNSGGHFKGGDRSRLQLFYNQWKEKVRNQ